MMLFTGTTVWQCSDIDVSILIYTVHMHAQFIHIMYRCAFSTLNNIHPVNIVLRHVQNWVSYNYLIFGQKSCSIVTVQNFNVLSGNFDFACDDCHKTYTQYNWSGDFQYIFCFIARMVCNRFGNIHQWSCLSTLVINCNPLKIIHSCLQWNLP